MSNELEKLMYTYNAAESFEITTFNDAANLKKISKLLANLKSFECPDMYASIDENTLILEHFEFDCMANSKTGSEYRKERARVSRGFKKAPHNDEDDVIFHDEIMCDESLNNYFNNLKSQFIRHYAKISEYKKNLSVELELSEKAKYITGFFIEDVTCLGTSYISDGGFPKAVVLVLCKQFLDLFEKSEDLDFVLFGCFYDNEYHLFFISKDSVEFCRELEIDLSELDIFKWNPVVTGYSFNAPDDI